MSLEIFNEAGERLITVDRAKLEAAFIEAMLCDRLITVNQHGRLMKDGSELKTDQMVHVFIEALSK